MAELAVSVTDGAYPAKRGVSPKVRAALIGRPIAPTRRDPEPVGHRHGCQGLRTVPVPVQKPLYSVCVVGYTREP